MVDVVLNPISMQTQIDAQAKTISAALQSTSLPATQLTEDFSNLNVGFHNFGEEADAASVSMGGFGDTLVKDISKVAEWTVATTLIFGSFKAFQAGVDYIEQLDQELTKIQIITGDSAAQVQALAMQYNNLATQLGSTTLAVTQGAEVWLKQGMSISDTNAMIKNSTELAQLAGMDATTSAQSLTAVMNSFNINAGQMSTVLDTLVGLSDKFAVSSEGLMTAIQRAGATANAAGVPLQDLASYIAVVANTTQKSTSSIGDSFNSMFSRMESVKAGATVDQFGESLNNVEKTLDTVGIALRDTTTGGFLPLNDVIDEIAQKWGTLSNAEQGEIATAVAGRNSSARTYSNIWAWL
jgi:TP901 family phage tail tape measure protein